MLVGDAAALIDPISGEGIWAAFVSGRIAGREALRYLSGEVSDLRGYQIGLEREVRDDIRSSRRLQGVLERLPALSPMLLKYSDTLWRYVTEIMRGELTYPDLPRRLGPLGHVVNRWGDLETRLHRRTLHPPALHS
jgi:flavin-dependent dehydrogenase